jgi:hypothetical protein
MSNLHKKSLLFFCVQSLWFRKASTITTIFILENKRKQANKQTNKQASKQANKRTNKQTKKHGQLSSALCTCQALWSVQTALVVYCAVIHTLTSKRNANFSKIQNKYQNII